MDQNRPIPPKPTRPPPPPPLVVPRGQKLQTIDQQQNQDQEQQQNKRTQLPKPTILSLAGQQMQNIRQGLKQGGGARLVPVEQYNQKQKQQKQQGGGIPPMQVSNQKQKQQSQNIRIPPPKPPRTYKIDSASYLNSLLDIINGFAKAVQNNNNKIVDIHNLDEARRLLSFLNNEYEAKKNNLTQGARIEIENRYQKCLELVDILDRVQELRLKQKYSKSQQEKAGLAEQLKKLTVNIPQVYQNDIIPTFSSQSGSKTGVFGWFQ